MREKKYSAGLVSQRFWFYETKQYIEMLNDNKIDKEIKQLSDEVNIFGAVSTSRAKEICNAARRRANILGKDMQEFFPSLNIDNQKIVILISVLLLNDLMLEFMMEVYQFQLQRGVLQLTPTDYKAFFSEKQRTNKVVASWKPYTYNRLASSYKNYLLESGLIRETKGVDTITPKILDSRVLKWLKSINRLDIIEAITGGI
ncbi:DUF1819 family protein [Liquorilactobacillus hordei]|uniref:Inner membrane protein (DUF1819) n=1 Tax=Liquorilactobacillus hordei DSM 19519 TaxID=1423759 RepID=A0A0R1MDJ4_9LACO|nr:DUF1819 family protein [Liquorilactobacillus hordei]KRL03908.1 hypothetical protein FC92_GL001924 [Liquorilactobacillus hordei DSM 19519]QYH52382.1 DUF1819 family protein [Liquorilactobacillus hordei DSM 19519]